MPKSKLTSKQWEDIERRMLADEPGRALAREYGVSETAIRKRLGSQTKQIKSVAIQLVAADAALRELPRSSQVNALALADDLKAMSSHLASAGKLGAMTAHKLTAIAHSQIEKIDEDEPMNSQDVLTGIAGLTKMANSSSEIAINLLRANKEFVEGLRGEGDISSMTEAEIRAELNALGD